MALESPNLEARVRALAKKGEPLFELSMSRETKDRSVTYIFRLKQGAIIYGCAYVGHSNNRFLEEDAHVALDQLLEETGYKYMEGEV
jgi:hypothetical protein